jgi:hypothetical protein
MQDFFFLCIRSIPSWYMKQWRILITSLSKAVKFAGLLFTQIKFCFSQIDQADVESKCINHRSNKCCRIKMLNYSILNTCSSLTGGAGDTAGVELVDGAYVVRPGRWRTGWRRARGGRRRRRRTEKVQWRAGACNNSCYEILITFIKS